MKIGVVGLDAAGCIIAGHLLAKTAHDIHMTRTAGDAVQLFGAIQQQNYSISVSVL